MIISSSPSAAQLAQCSHYPLVLAENARQQTVAQHHQIIFSNLHFIATGSSLPLGCSGGKHPPPAGDGSKWSCKASTPRSSPIHAAGVFSILFLYQDISVVLWDIHNKRKNKHTSKKQVTSSFPADPLSAALPLAFPGL